MNLVKCATCYGGRNITNPVVEAFQISALLNDRQRSEKQKAAERGPHFNPDII